MEIDEGKQPSAAISLTHGFCRRVMRRKCNATDGRPVRRTPPAARCRAGQQDRILEEFRQPVPQVWLGVCGTHCVTFCVTAWRRTFARRRMRLANCTRNISGLNGIPKGTIVAPWVGFEPTTVRLTVGCSTTELPRNSSERPQRAGLIADGCRKGQRLIEKCLAMDIGPRPAR